MGGGRHALPSSMDDQQLFQIQSLVARANALYHAGKYQQAYTHPSPCYSPPTLHPSLFFFEPESSSDGMGATMDGK